MYTFAGQAIVYRTVPFFLLLWRTDSSKSDSFRCTRLAIKARGVVHQPCSQHPKDRLTSRPALGLLFFSHLSEKSCGLALGAYCLDGFEWLRCGRPLRWRISSAFRGLRHSLGLRVPLPLLGLGHERQTVTLGFLSSFCFLLDP